MKMTVTNKKIAVDSVEVRSVLNSSLFLVGDSDIITCSFLFDTPADSLVFGPYSILSAKKSAK